MGIIVEMFIELFGIDIPIGYHWDDYYQAYSTVPLTLVDVKEIMLAVALALLIFRGALKIITTILLEMVRMRRL